ncbi:MAG: PTS lactose/cellobiose transporter subunit IIA [Erysipelotrichaceae bacterium]|jgi:PTS system cellobiose-specific IIA component
MNNDTMIAFEVIMHAGNSKSLVMKAMDEAENENFIEAEKLISEAEKEANKTHLVYKDLLDRVSNGEVVVMDLLMTHALDHMTSTDDTIIMAKKFLYLCKKIGGENND